VLETDRLILREWTVDDAEAAFAISGDPDVTRYLGATGEPHPDIAYTRQRLESLSARYPTWNGCGNWAAVEKATGEVIGGGGLVELESGPDVEVFYHFRRDRWGMGYATEMTKALIAYAFDRMDLARVVGVAFPANTASHQVMLKSGMTHQGLHYCYDHNLEYFVIDRPTDDAR
jgi:[ribosomal protein S5]-alanine N-acetyltransferase